MALENAVGNLFKFLITERPCPGSALKLLQKFENLRSFFR